MHREQHCPQLTLTPSGACSIGLQHRVILTGGHDSNYGSRRVTAYSEAGFLAELPSLITGRSEHACSHYVDSENLLVRLKLVSITN